jgi:hypothetical protein
MSMVHLVLAVVIVGAIGLTIFGLAYWRFESKTKKLPPNKPNKPKSKIWNWKIPKKNIGPRLDHTSRSGVHMRAKHPNGLNPPADGSSISRTVQESF